MAEIERALRVLHDQSLAFEIRALRCGYDGTVSGNFNNIGIAARAVAELDGGGVAGGIYVTLNPIDAALLARANNRLVKKARSTTSDLEVARRRWFFIDVDANRPSGISANEDEKARARQRTDYVRTFLCDILTWPQPVTADSGNGYHVLFRIDLPNDDNSRLLIENALKALAARFSGDGVSIDCTVSNVARIIKAPGTVARKGDPTAERPHRRSQILNVPEALDVVSLEQLTALAAMAPNVAPKEMSGVAIDLEMWLRNHGVDVDRMKLLGNGTFFALASCPFSADHEDGAWAAQFVSGALSAGCHHARCSGKGWRELRSMFEADSHGPADVRNEPAAIAVAAPIPQLRLVNLDKVTPRLIDWLWAKRIPLGKLTMLVGDPGGGKTFVTLALASALTRGRRLPDDSREPAEPARVVVLNFEDGTDDTIRPRAESAGCDLSRVVIIEGVTEGSKLFPFGAHHVHQLDAVLESMPDVRMLVIDPIAQLLGHVNTSKDNEVRTALQPLKEMAERCNIAVVCIVHLRKAEAERTLYRVSGSVAFVGFARSVLLVAEDENGRRSISPGTMKVVAYATNGPDVETTTVAIPIIAPSVVPTAALTPWAVDSKSLHVSVAVPIAEAISLTVAC